MKKTEAKKLTLNRESLRLLGEEILDVAGAAQDEIWISQRGISCDSRCSCSTVQ